MPTLAEITEGHSRRISQISQRRDSRLREAMDARDRQLRALPKAARFYGAFDQQVSDARKKQVTTDAKAEAARAGALQRAHDALSAALERAQRSRRDADTAAFEKRRSAEEDIEHEFILAIAASGVKPSTAAQKIRADKLAKAKREFEDALSAAQDQFRKERDRALIADGQGARDANRAYRAAATASESSARSARSAAEQKLAKGISALPEAAAAVDDWRQATAAIVADYRREEAEEFERFHREMEALRG